MLVIVLLSEPAPALRDARETSSQRTFFCFCFCCCATATATAVHLVECWCGVLLAVLAVPPLVARPAGRSPTATASQRRRLVTRTAIRILFDSNPTDSRPCTHPPMPALCPHSHCALNRSSHCSPLLLVSSLGDGDQWARAVGCGCGTRLALPSVCCHCTVRVARAGRRG